MQTSVKSFHLLTPYWGRNIRDNGGNKIKSGSLLKMICMLAELFYNKYFLSQLTRTPGMTWKAGIPEKFASYTREYVRSLLNDNLYVPEGVKTKYVGAAPAAWTWLEAMPECLAVRDQGSCGSCWAFNAVGGFTDNRCIYGKDPKRIYYSEYYVVSCDKTDSGCGGGYLDKVQFYLVETGTTTDKCVSYKSGTSGVTGKCPTTCDDGSEIVLTHADHTENICTSIESLMVGLTQSTISTHFTVYSDFMYYTGGIYQHKTGYREGGHAVLFVGYGEEDGVKFWYVTNSWGEDWGESGYFRIIKGQNECGIEADCYQLTP